MHENSVCRIQNTCSYSARLVTLRACCGAVYCNRSCLLVCGCMCVCLLPRELETACIDPHQTGLVGKGSDHLQLIKFWPSRAPGKGSAAGWNFWLRLTTASAQCLRLLRAFFFIVSFLYPCVKFSRLWTFIFAACCYCAPLLPFVYYLII